MFTNNNNNIFCTKLLIIKFAVKHPPAWWQRCYNNTPTSPIISYSNGTKQRTGASKTKNFQFATWSVSQEQSMLSDDIENQGSPSVNCRNKYVYLRFR
jgi:hypothetical protein